MEPFHEYINEYRNQLAKGAIQKAYKGLMEYIMALRTHFKNNYPDYFVSGSIYYGYMDMTYFSFTPQSLKHRNLKIAIVFIHETCRFEAWLGGYNKQVQQKYWKLFKDVRLNKLTILELTITANNDDRTINWISYFISRPKQSGWNKYHIVSTIKGRNP